MGIKSQFFSMGENIPEHLSKLCEVFKKNENHISSETHRYSSNKVLHELTYDIEDIGFRIEKGKTRDKLIILKVYKPNGEFKREYDVDGLHKESNTILEVEACRAVPNNQTLKDVLKAASIKDTNYLVIAVRNQTIIGQGKNKKVQKDFNKVTDEIEDILNYMPPKNLKGILIIGY